MEITTPAIVFSVVSLTLLGYSNRFHSISALVRKLEDKKQVSILIKRLIIIKYAILYGQGSLLAATLSIGSAFFQQHGYAGGFFAASLLCLLIAIVLIMIDTLKALLALEIEK